MVFPLTGKGRIMAFSEVSNKMVVNSAMIIRAIIDIIKE
jgi:hypothetical protein